MVRDDTTITSRNTMCKTTITSRNTMVSTLHLFQEQSHSETAKYTNMYILVLFGSKMRGVQEHCI